MRGQFRFYLPDRELVVPNNVLDEGEESFLKMITRADVADVASAGNFYIGLCGDIFEEDTTLATLTGEPDATGGYARQAATRDSTGWPTLDTVNGIWRAATQTLTFTASGANFSTSIQRAFLCNVAAGTLGKLFSVSGPLPEALLLSDGQSLPMRYELFLR